MPAIDTIAAYQGTSGSTLAAATMATGDSATIRSFPPTSMCRLLGVGYDDVTSPLPFRVRSPLMHDAVQGIEWDPGTAAPTELTDPQILQRFYPQDALTIELSTAATTGKALAAFMLYYDQLPGNTARLYALADILPRVVNVKPLRVAVGSGANTAGAWYDLVITTTENLLKANTDYAVLGITCTAAVAAIGIKGSDTGSLRICAPGGTNNPNGVEYFSRLSRLTGLATIPVINAANAGSTYISLISSAATGAASVVSVYLAQLTPGLS